MNKRLLFIPTLVLAGMLVYSSGKAARADDNASSWRQEMVSALAQKLGLSEDKVGTALDEVHEQMRAEHDANMQQNFEERLQSLVDEGKLTEGQREAFLAKREEMMAERDANRREHHEEMQTWFQEQGIDPSIMVGLGPRSRFGGMHEGQ